MMSTEKSASKTAETAVDTHAKGALAAPVRVTVDKGMRPLYSEIARLSATLGIARKCCYDGDPRKAREALLLLAMQLPAVMKLAEILAPETVAE